MQKKSTAETHANNSLSVQNNTVYHKAYSQFPLPASVHAHEAQHGLMY